MNWSFNYFSMLRCIMNTDLYETICIISVCASRGAFMVSKFECDVSKLVLNLEKYDEDAIQIITSNDGVPTWDEHDFMRLQQIFKDGNKCSDCSSCDEYDTVFGRNRDCLNDMINMLEKTFVGLYNMKDEFTLIKNKLLSIEWGDSMVDIV